MVFCCCFALPLSLSRTHPHLPPIPQCALAPGSLCFPLSLARSLTPTPTLTPSLSLCSALSPLASHGSCPRTPPHARVGHNLRRPDRHPGHHAAQREARPHAVQVGGGLCAATSTSLLIVSQRYTTAHVPHAPCDVLYSALVECGLALAIRSDPTALSTACPVVVLLYLDLGFVSCFRRCRASSE